MRTMHVTTVFLSKAQHASCSCEAVWTKEAPCACLILNTANLKEILINQWHMVFTTLAVKGAKNHRFKLIPKSCSSSP